MFSALHCGSRKSQDNLESHGNLENVNASYGSASTVPFAPCVYLTSCLDAEDGHTCLWVILKLVHQLNPFRRRDTAINPYVTNLKQKERIISAGRVRL